MHILIYIYRDKREKNGRNYEGINEAQEIRVLGILFWHKLLLVYLYNTWSTVEYTNSQTFQVITVS